MRRCAKIGRGEGREGAGGGNAYVVVHDHDECLEGGGGEDIRGYSGNSNRNN